MCVAMNVWCICGNLLSLHEVEASRSYEITINIEKSLTNASNGSDINNRMDKLKHIFDRVARRRIYAKQNSVTILPRGELWRHYNWFLYLGSVKVEYTKI